MKGSGPCFRASPDGRAWRTLRPLPCHIRASDSRASSPSRTPKCKNVISAALMILYPPAIARMAEVESSPARKGDPGPGRGSKVSSRSKSVRRALMFAPIPHSHVRGGSFGSRCAGAVQSRRQSLSPSVRRESRPSRRSEQLPAPLEQASDLLEPVGRYAAVVVGECDDRRRTLLHSHVAGGRGATAGRCERTESGDRRVDGKGLLCGVASLWSTTSSSKSSPGLLRMEPARGTA